MSETTPYRPVEQLDERQFGKLLQKHLSPAEPLQSVERLRGREEQLTDIRRALYASGRHVFVHGYRGVGKTSLARTSAFQIQSADANPIIVGCTSQITFHQLIRDILVEAVDQDPMQIKETLAASGGLKAFGLSGTASRQIERGEVPIPESINDAVRMISLVQKIHSNAPVIVVDEFDTISDPNQQQYFADFIKQISDRHINVKFICCGIGETLEEIIKAHRSAHRYFHPIRLGRLGWEARFEIIDNAAEQLGVEVDTTSRIRVAMISDGFPHYVHLIAEKLFWNVFESDATHRTNGALFEQALQAASDAMEPELKIPYETATRKYRNDYEEILFAVADGHELQRPSHEIYKSYCRIMESLDQTPLTRQQFNNRMNNLKKEAYAAILSGTRQGWYEFSEKVIRGYARLRAVQKGVLLEAEHPEQKRRFKW